MDFASHLLAISGFLALFILSSKVWRKKKGESRNNKGITPPEPSRVLPIIGHLHLLHSHKPPARTLAAMSDQCGHIFALRLGGIRAVFVNNAEAVKECFTTYDKVLAARPKSGLGEYLVYKNAVFTFTSYSPFYREIRKIVMTQLLSPHKLKSLSHIPTEEVNIFIKELNGRTKVVINEMFEKLTLNVITRMIAGKRCFGMANDVENESQEGRIIGKVMKEFMSLSESPMLSDMIPILRFLDSSLGPLKTWKRLSRELTSVMQEWIEQHKLAAKTDSEVAKDLMDSMLSALQDDVMFGHSRETIIKGTSMTLMIAAAETTSITLTWILSNLLSHRHVMELARQEIDLKVGKERWVDQSDITKLIYLQNVIKETLRLYPPAPVAIPHEATEDICISGYHIAKGTQLFVNLWKLHRDPSIWPDPNEFKPERFGTEEAANIDISGHCFELIPFGSGRRSCPGMTFALQFIPLTVARLLQGFEITTTMNLPVDMSEGLGVTLRKATPLEIEVTPRLCPQLYN